MRARTRGPVSALASLLEALERETRSVREAARAGELEACDALFARRAETLAALQEALRRPGVDAVAIGQAAERALACDAQLVAELGARRDSLRAELDEVRQARRTAQRVTTSDRPSRFVSERV